jgi:signal transduction histidine kinase
VEWIEGDLGDNPPAEVVKNLARVSQRIHRMERLIDDLLSYARAGRAATDYVRITLDTLLHDALELQPLPAGFTLESDLAASPFQATRVPLETALRNLISNAVKHHDRGTGVIRISAREDDNHCIISVSDDGPGVPAAAQERIFKLFQTLTASTRGGSGIGLALTKRVIEVHGGRIELVSPVADGRGACFRFWWPRFPRRSSDEPA